ncbi:ricin-type beta-trefoil lectin domain protein [Kitasatospora sp. MAP5-34]|uniref:RICIN domain-containing protein n=1 Tax=Kitasatospora sp. MAP5-34 TaxID=3035102 RepID=UPI0024752EAE|nr:ricin-type beta-trefoil lectin domain protein [Kitasatospora sp. MAP5-34]MDH6574467.1 hypothetical protein [Kitasatospora sp. MAP5-34]
MLFRRCLRSRARRLALTVAGVVLAMLSTELGFAGPATASGSTPGSYTSYAFPSGTSALSKVSFDTLVESDPGQGNVFWSHQFAFTNSVSGYIGMQRHRTDPGMFLISLWNATAAKPGDSGTYCQTFTEGGSGYTCRLDSGFTAGHNYLYDLTPASDGWYQAKVTDTTAGTSFVLGTLQVGSGAQISASGMTDWVEYFDWNYDAANCGDEPYSVAAFSAPTGTDASTGARVAASVSSTRLSSTCSAQGSVTTDNEVTTHSDAIGNSSSGPITGTGGKCVDISGANGMPLQLWTCGQWSDSQNWVVANDGTIHALFECMTVNGTAVQLSTCNGSAGQKWQLTAGTLVNPNTNKCLDTTGASSADGTKLNVQDCNGGASQQWYPPFQAG